MLIYLYYTKKKDFHKKIIVNKKGGIFMKDLAAILLRLPAKEASIILRYMESGAQLNVLLYLKKEHFTEYQNMVEALPFLIRKKVMDAIDKNSVKFEQIIKLERHDLITVLNSISQHDLLAVALVNASDDVKEHVFNAISKGRKQLLLDAFDSLHEPTEEDIHKAQQVVLDRIVDLTKKGMIFGFRPKE